MSMNLPRDQASNSQEGFSSILFFNPSGGSAADWCDDVSIFALICFLNDRGLFIGRTAKGNPGSQYVKERTTWWPSLWIYSHRLAARKFAPLAPDTAEPEDRCFPLNSEIQKSSGRSWAEDCSKLGQPKEVLLYTYYILHILVLFSVQVCHPFQASCE